MATAALVWSRVAWRGVTVTARFHPLRVFAGQPLFLTIKLANAKRLPIPIARLSVWLPPGLQPGDDDEPTTIRGFRRRAFVGGRRELTFELPVRTRRRGAYWVER